MAFLDNSGDIILDAVLTDAGRARLARGDGSFKIVKYAFADDEIDYSKYDLNHDSGSAYYDINILTTPVIEALTNNTSTMKNRLMSIPKTNLLYLPKIVLNVTPNTLGRELNTETATSQTYIISVDSNTDSIFYGNTSITGGKINDGYWFDHGIFLSNTDTNATAKDDSTIITDQGLDTTAISKEFTLDPTLRETQYIVEIDNRLGYITDSFGNQQKYSFLDDDNIASYSFSASDITMVGSIAATQGSPIAGPRGTRLAFRVAPSIELNSSPYLFGLLGESSTNLSFDSKTNDYGRIDSSVRVTGATTGYRLNIPIVFLKDVV